MFTLAMPRVQAWEQLNNPEYCSQLGMADFYELLRQAGYDEDRAQEAANERGNRRLDVGLTP